MRKLKIISLNTNKIDTIYYCKKSNYVMIRTLILVEFLSTNIKKIYEYIIIAILLKTYIYNITNIINQAIENRKNVR